MSLHQRPERLFYMLLALCVALTPLESPVLGQYDDCGSAADEGTCGCAIPAGPAFSTGYEFVIVKPHFDKNQALATLKSDGATFENFRRTEFDYDMELSSRVWLQYEMPDGLGLRVRYWKYAESPESVSANPPANGLGRIDHPVFADVDVSSTIPDEIYSASSELDVYTIDIEATRTVDFGNWWVNASIGLRVGSVEQAYLGQLTDNAGTLLGQIDFEHELRGAGSTMSVYVARSCVGLTLFGMARGSLLLSEGESTLFAREDLDLTNSFNTNRTSDRDDLLPIGEIQVGLEWRQSYRTHNPFIRAAFESQVWGDAGSASSEEGNLGFFGISVALGMDW